MAAKPRKRSTGVRFKKKALKQQTLTLTWGSNYAFSLMLNGENGKLVTRPYHWQYSGVLEVFEGRDAWNILIPILEMEENSSASTLATLPSMKKAHDFAVSEKMRGMIVDVVHTIRVYETLYEPTQQDSMAFDRLKHFAALALVRLHQHDRAIRKVYDGEAV